MSAPDVPKPADASKPRVFFAAALAPPLRDDISGLARRVARQCSGRPVPGDNLHLTLAFIGAIERSRLPAVLAAGSAVRAGATTIDLDRLGGFRRAAVAWVGPSAPVPALDALAADVLRTLGEANIGCDARAFHPHVTIARHCRAMPEAGPAGPWRWRIGEIVLFESPAGTGRSRYRALATWPLGVPGATCRTPQSMPGARR
ncbi:MAG: RNA 2',3'-cyclic phosphodiesterase [Proteobacteria bacterium]|nr:RNA 2',3'-cyclic phosphodiesterase [Pseudomonadota bacterium]